MADRLPTSRRQSAYRRRIAIRHEHPIFAQADDSPHWQQIVIRREHAIFAQADDSPHWRRIVIHHERPAWLERRLHDLVVDSIAGHFGQVAAELVQGLGAPARGIA